MSTAPTVVCVVDLSHRSGTVVQHAWEVAEHFRARLIAATVTTAEVSSIAALTAVVSRALPAAHDWAPECRVRDAAGPTADTILHLAHEEGADLLVIGTHGAGGNGEQALGSTTAAVLRNADLPVLLVPNSVAHLHFDNRRELRNLASVVAPVDFSPLSHRDARIAHAIAATLDVPLLLVHACPATPASSGLDPAAALAQLSDLRAELGGPAPIETVTVSGEPATAIAALASARNAGLVVMGLRGAGGVDGPKPGSIAYRMLCAAPTMLLALPPILRRPAPAATDHDRAPSAA
jgi:nucleotide-binding universal stress UspA family protein